MSTQIIFSHGDTSQGNPISPLRGSTLQSISAGDSTPIVTPGVMSNLSVILSSAPGAGASWTATIQKNDVDTALAVTISGAAATSGSDTAHQISFAAGDTIRLNWTTGGASSKAWVTSIEWTPTTAGENIYEFSGDFTNATDIPVFGAVGAGSGGTGFSATSIVASAGTISKIRVNTRSTPTGGNSFTYRLRLNGVDQDGTGGTTDTRATITAGNTSANSSFTPIAIAAGDLISIRYTQVGANTSAYDVGTVVFTPTNANESCSNVNGNTAGPSTTVTNYTYPRSVHNSGFDAWSTTESVRNYSGAATATVTLTAFYVAVSTAPGVGKSRTFTVRKNAADTGLVVTISDNATSGNITGQSVPLSALSDRWTIKAVPSGTPAACFIKTSVLMVSTPLVTAPPVTRLLVSP